MHYIAEEIFKEYRKRIKGNLKVEQRAEILKAILKERKWLDIKKIEFLKSEYHEQIGNYYEEREFSFSRLSSLSISVIGLLLGLDNIKEIFMRSSLKSLGYLAFNAIIIIAAFGVLIKDIEYSRRRKYMDIIRNLEKIAYESFDLLI